MTGEARSIEDKLLGRRPFRFCLSCCVGGATTLKLRGRFCDLALIDVIRGESDCINAHKVPAAFASVSTNCCRNPSEGRLEFDASQVCDRARVL